MKPLTVAFVNFTRKWGGVRTWTLDFGQALSALGHRVVTILRPGTAFEEACSASAFSVHALRPGFKYNPLAIVRIMRTLRREKADVVVVNISKDLDVGAVAAKLCSLPVVHRVGLAEDFRDTTEERWRHRFLVDRILVPSQYLRTGLLERLDWLRPAEISVIPNSKALDRYALAPGSGGPEVVFGVTSQLSPSKGHTYLLQAMQSLVADGRTVRLRVAGTGSLEESLKAEARDRGLGRIVEFLGFQTDIPAFLATVDVYVLPSANESFSNAVLEAMASALPVVAFEAGGVPEVVGDAGVLTPPGDPTALASAMGRLAADANLRAALGGAARRRAEQRYDLKRNALTFETLLREVAGP